MSLELAISTPIQEEVPFKPVLIGFETQIIL